MLIEETDYQVFLHEEYQPRHGHKRDIQPFIPSLAKILAHEPNHSDNKAEKLVKEAMTSALISDIPGCSRRVNNQGVFSWSYIEYMNADYDVVFFPGRQKSNHEAVVRGVRLEEQRCGPSDTELRDNPLGNQHNHSTNFWRDASVAYLCSAIDKYTEHARKSLNTGRLTEALLKYQDDIVRYRNRWYGGGYTKAYADELPDLVAATDDTALSYIAVLKTPEWAQLVNSRLVGTDALNKLWFFFHHYAKLYAMGVNPKAIDVLLNDISPSISDGIPENGRFSKSRTAPWWVGGDFDHSFLVQARSQMQVGVDKCWGSILGENKWVTIEEGYSKLFCDKGEPGNRYC